MNARKFGSKISLFVCFVISTNVNAAEPGPLHVPSPDWRDQIIYMVMIDRFNDGNPENNDQGVGEYNPALDSHFSGGDLQGLRDKIDYIQGLGATAVWPTPPVAQQWWSASSHYSGYHGYWASDFKSVDRHYGSLADMQALSRALHGKGMYLVQDVVVNHVGNFFQYDPAAWKADAPDKGFHYLPEAGQGHAPVQYPFSQNNGADPKQAALGIYHWTPDIADYAVPEQRERWQMGGLDDLNTDNPVVRQALRDSHGFWIREVGVDAFRVDTAFYVPPEYFRDFLYADDPSAPGMLKVAEQTGRKDFHVFGEGFALDRPYEETQSRRIESYVRQADGQALMPAMINFPLYGTALDVFAKGRPTQELGDRIERMMRVHENPHAMPSFVDNHDVERFLASGSVAGLKQNLLLLMTLPGIPVIYYGTEQGFTGMRDAMFKSGYGAKGRDHFNTESDLYRTLQDMTALRKSHRVFSRGTPSVLRVNSAGTGVLAYRMDYDGQSAWVLFNTSDAASLLNALPTELPAGSVLQVAYALNTDQKTQVIGSDGTLSMAMPARSALVLLPQSLIAPEAPLAMARPSIDTVPAILSKDRIRVRGHAAPNAELWLVLDGNLAQAVRTRSNASGRWQAMLDISDLADETVRHSLAAWQPAQQLASAERAFTVNKTWRHLLTYNDPQGDDTGRNGLLRYPTDASWGENRQGDIEQVSIARAGTSLRIDVRLRTLTAFWNPANGFDHVALTAFFALPGQTGGTEIMPQQNATLPEALRWQFRLRTHGWSNAWFSAETATADREGSPLSPGPQLQVLKAQRTLRITVPAKALGNPATLSGLKLYLNTWDFDGGYRALTAAGGPMAFGGGSDDSAKIMDETAIITLP